MDRINKLASLTAGSKIVCDIGCDHAYTLVKAIEEYKVLKGIGVDINPMPLANALKNIKAHHLEDQVELILSNGFENVNSLFDTAIISGMGGLLICDILKAGLSKIKNKKLIIEANCDADKVRCFLFDNGFKLVDEFALYDKNKYYEIMVFVTGQEKNDIYDILYGKYLRIKREEAFVSYYRKKKALLEDIISKVNDDKIKAERRVELIEINNLIEGYNMEKYFINNTKNFYRTYFIDNTKRPTILISPGGGYKYTSPRESEPVAKAFNARGYHAVIVNYREELLAYPKPQDFLASAIDEVAKDKRVGKIIGLGFSAGGHCILETILHGKDHSLKSEISLLILGYPVITSDKRFRHNGSFENLLQENINDEKLLNYLSLETQVTKDAPDLFLWGTYTDESVPVMNSLLLLEAYNEAKANAEYHSFYYGGHAMSLANSSTSDGDQKRESKYISKWFDLACDWLNSKLSK